MSQIRRFRSGGLAAWSIEHPVGVTMIALAVIVLGLFSLWRLNIDLLPHLIYPEVRVRIVDPGVPAQIMEDRITRNLEEQLAITEDAVGVQSSTSEGTSSVDLSFPYGKDIDIALRDASTRLDRAKRFLPDTIDPPVIYKRDPSQIPVYELVVSSSLRTSVELREWMDYVLSKWLLNLPGVAAAEVGGGLVREVQVLPDQQRLAGVGLTMEDLVRSIREGNVEVPGGRVQMQDRQMSSRVQARFTSVDQLSMLPITGAGQHQDIIRLHEVAAVNDGNEEEQLRIRLNGAPGIKLSIQKQPQANTVAVVAAVKERLDWLRQQQIVPTDIAINAVADQSVFIENAMGNAILAALSGAILAMLVVYVFLGSVRRTLIIGSAIPIAVVVAFIIMQMGGLTLNIMTLGGLALGVGMLVDNTIVMLENIYRHQREGEVLHEASVNAAREVNSAIFASTSTNLAAVLPFLFIGGLIGLLFRELIFTISAAIAASLVVAMSLVPAYSAMIPVGDVSRVRQVVDGVMTALQNRYHDIVAAVLPWRWLLLALSGAGLALSVPVFLSDQQEFLPKMDEGQISVSFTADPGVSLEQMDRMVQHVEDILQAQPEVQTVFSTVGGRVFGRSQTITPNSSTLQVQLVPRRQRAMSSDEWVKAMTALMRKERVAGMRVQMRTQGIRGVRISSGDEDVSLRIQGDDLEQLRQLADQLADQLKTIDGLRSVAHSLEEVKTELALVVDRVRAASFGLSPDEIGNALRMAVQGIVVSEFFAGDRSVDIRVRLPAQDIANPQDLERIVLFYDSVNREPVYLGDVAQVQLIAVPASVQRDQQRRIVEVSAAIGEGVTLGAVHRQISDVLAAFPLPVGITVYESGAAQALQEGKAMGAWLLMLALFLVFVVMAVQYESLRNPLVIMLSVPFALVGVAIGLWWSALPLSMPVWLGLIMLAGIVVNNAIVLVEYIEICRERGMARRAAILEAARLRLRPILMTTLTTVVGMVPLALGIGEGSEMLQPLAVTIVSGLLFSMLVSLLLVPVIYSLLAPPDAAVSGG